MPRAPSTDSIATRSWANLFAGHHHRGACADLSAVAFPEHPSAREMTRGLVQTGGLARRSDSAPRKALRRSSSTAPRCLESVSTTDVSRHEHPRQNITFGDRSPSAVGNPPAFDFETALGGATFPPFHPRTAPDHLAVIRPPTAPCLTARRRLALRPSLLRE
jgi:hypothetical protein